MKLIKWSLSVLILAMVSATQVSAAEIAFFDNPTYTDPGEESANLAASLTSLGHNIQIFSGIEAIDWQTATQDADLLVIPELDNGDLFDDLSVAAAQVVFDYVDNGGGMLMFDRADGPTPNMLNGVFGFSLVGGSGGVTSLNAAAAVGTPFEGGPAALSDPSATELMLTNSLPAGALDLYNDQVSQTSVFTVVQGSGSIGYLAFDWFEQPTPAAWEEVLGRSVDAVQGTSTGESISIPTLDFVGLAALALILLALGITGIRRRIY